MTPEERIARLEARTDGLDAWLKDIAADVRALRDIASIGNGAFKVILKIGGVFTALFAIAVAVYDRFPSHK